MSGRIGIDTNVLLRIAIPDDARQMDAVSRLLDRLDADDILFINVSVILEASWVLNRKYRYPRDRILDFIQAILERREFEVADYEAVGNAIHICRMSNVDFADALLSEMNRIDDCSKTFTFDKKAAARVPGMELLT
ncbi:type II toxin-antitoxin system VapC family toxin [Neorhizobium sp. Rsf11]|uniref:Type II toxin-antitoxin system VapC family toxin n=2 Tax=Neorhizobium TaxID=1525371 RepID=A0ABV0LXQ0_9HYPH|nr:type II toxin-antitoxin system VapC family toxin [Neorhizobium petrolearium]MCC2611404.1 type II toxin-antitoxin system VapC family toxin [Neorhizobium petrolearium]WGI66597.1 type II toxin-antitoxin system VapC family toxin [Neorhizobium petrolearium]